jgi:hypothetical protein
MRDLLAAAAAAVLLALAGCAVVPLGSPTPSLQNVAAFRAAALPPLALGNFTLAADRDASLDRRVAMRAVVLHSPSGGSFAAYLKETFAADLRAAGLLDPRAECVISAQLTDNQLTVPTGVASATLSARFTVTRGSSPVYSKELQASYQWSAEFIGFEALPNALNVYEQLYRKLTRNLLEDPEFLAAVKR